MTKRLPVFRSMGRGKITTNLNQQFSAHHAYVSEVSAHWISAYFRGDVLRLPRTIGETLDAAQYDGEWVRRRYPYILKWMSESNSSAVAFWT